MDFRAALINPPRGIDMVVDVVDGPRRRRGHAALFALCAALAALVLSAAPAAAQLAEPRNFPVERFRWTFARTGVLGAEWAAVPEAGSWDLGLWLGTANDPLVLYREEADGSRTEVSSLVAQRTSAALLLSYTPWRRLELGLELPLVLAQSRDERAGGSTSMLSSIAGAGLGDLRLAAKLGLLRSGRHGLDVALLASLILPSGGGDDYRGERGVAFAPELAISRQLRRTRLAINAGYRARQNASLLNLAVVDELSGVLAVAQATSARTELALGLSLATAAESPLSADNQDHVEALAGLTWDAPGPLLLSFVGGLGLQEGFGTPDWRGVLALRFGEVRVAGASQARPAPMPIVEQVPPPPDGDGDGLPDPADRCPLEPETANGYQDDDGCPDSLDRDGDGVRDDVDRCPDEPEDLDGFSDDDGCPDPDDDGDGLLDAADRCPAAAGPRENLGCPDADRDGDGLVDRLDNCPDERGSPANRGCAKKQRVALADGVLELLEVVHFETSRDRVLPRSFPLLDNVAAVLVAHPELTRIDVEGHTDSAGDAAYNKDLSQRRAAAVVRYLEGRGVRAALLVPIGHGEERPVADNATPAGRAKNRRVELHTKIELPRETVIDFPDEVIESKPLPKPPVAPAK